MNKLDGEGKPLVSGVKPNGSPSSASPFVETITISSGAKVMDASSS